MNHSIYTIRDYVCEFYGITPEEVQSKSLQWTLVRARQMIVILAEKGNDQLISEVIGRYRCQIPVIRKTILGNMQYNKIIRGEFEKLKQGLLKYEIQWDSECKTLMHCI